MTDILELIPTDRDVSRGHVWRKARKHGWTRHGLNTAIKDMLSSGKVVAVNARIRRAA